LKVFTDNITRWYFFLALLGAFEIDNIVVELLCKGFSGGVSREYIASGIRTNSHAKDRRF
jgi:hypothetical protein